MGSLKIFWYLFLFSLSYTFAFAEVNIAYGEFKLQHEDSFSSPQEKLIRNYSSRSLFKGLFGYGWCSSWDYRKTYSQGQERILLCQEEVTPKDKIIFNDKGELLTIEKSDLKILFLQENSHPVNLETKNKKTLYVLIKDGFVRKIKSEKQTISYEYKEKQLSKVTKEKSSLYRYEYDSFANMTKWHSTKEFESMSYNNEWDLIESYTQKDLCTNEYNYSFLNKSKFIFQKRKCLSKPSQAIKYSFDALKKKIKIEVIESKDYRLGEKNENLSSTSL